MSNAERQAKITSESTNGLFAVLSDLLRGGGSGAGFSGGRTALLHLTALLTLTVVALLALTSGSASAAVARQYESSITEAGGAPFGVPQGLAVDGSDNLWVADPGNAVVDKFGPTATFLKQTNGKGHFSNFVRSIGFSNASNRLYVADSNFDDLWVIKPDGGFETGYTGAWNPSHSGCCFINTAADNSVGATGGDIYVSGEGNGVYRIDAAGEPAPFSAAGEPGTEYIEGTKLTGTPTESFGGEVTALATDSNGNLFAATQSAVYEYEPSGEFVQAITEANGSPFVSVFALASDSDSGNLLVADSGAGAIDEFRAGGEYLQQTTEANGEPFGNLNGLAVASSGTLYASDSSRQVVDVFAPLVLPKITYKPVSSLTTTSVTLHAEADPNGGGEIESCIFEYGETRAYGQTAPCQPPPPYAALTEVSSELSGLNPNGRYHYRLVLANASGTRTGSDQTFPPGPPVIEGSSVSGIEANAATVEVKINPSGFDTHYKIEYGTSSSYGSESVETNIGSSSGDVASSVGLTGLLASTTYHYRVVAANECEPVEHPGQECVVSSAEDETFTTAPALLIDSTSVSGVSATAATLETEINPLGNPTTYRFEYDTLPYAEGEGPHGTSTPTGSAGSGTADVTRTAPLGGLVPSITYHFRVVAENSLGTIEGPDRTFTTQGAAVSSLPDDRAWELVSPPDKQGAALEAIGGPFGEGAAIQAAADGSSLTYVARAPITAEPPNNRSLANSQLLAHRSATGAWQTQDVGIPHGAPVGLGSSATSEYQLFSSDLSSAAIQPQGDTPLSDEATEPTPYLRQSDGSFTPILTAANVPPGVPFGGKEGGGGGGPVFVTGTPDLSHVLFESPKALTDEFSPTYEPTYESPYNIYEWNAGALALVSQIPPEASTACGGSGPACVPVSELGFSASAGNVTQLRNAISADGSRVVFNASGSVGTHLYARDLTRDETVQLDVFEGGGDGPNGRPVFQTATADGSRVLFKDGRRLTANSTATQAKPDLYMCQIKESAGHLTCDLTDLTANTLDPSEPANVLGTVIGTSEDGSVIYFVANGALTEGEGAVHGDCQQTGNPTEERCNLYRYDTATASLKLVAVISAADATDWAAEGNDLRYLTGRVSPDGRYLAFMSQRSLTGYDNRDAKTGVRDQEVYLYDSEADGGQGRLLCPSCNPTGARPNGVEATFSPGLLVDRSRLWGGSTLAANIPGWSQVVNIRALYQSRFLSSSGRLFFNAADALVPGDTNGTFDVYQFEFPQGPGQPASNTCTTASPTYSPVSGGCTSLVSSGTSPEESAFLDASETGNDVFFLTAAKLLPRDVDAALDLYDARVGGGEPAPVNPVECSGDACQQPITLPNDPTPGSLTFHGAGNLLQCPKGKKPQQGKCVKQRAKKKHHKKKSHKKHAKKRANSYRGGAK